MTISSRTPEGLPQQCPVCGKSAALEPSDPGGDSVCPRCGQLLGWFREHFGESVGLRTSFKDDLGTDSLDMVELAQELEEKFDVAIPDEEIATIKTVGDAIRCLVRLLGE